MVDVVERGSEVMCINDVFSAEVTKICDVGWRRLAHCIWR